MNRRFFVSRALPALCAIALIPAAHAAGGSITLRQLPGESLPSFVAAFDTGLALAQTADGRTSVQLRVSDADRSGYLAEFRFANGDELVRIDKEPIFTTAAARTIVHSKQPGGEMTFVVKNKGASRVIAFEILPTTTPAVQQSAPQPAPQPASAAIAQAQAAPVQNAPRPVASTSPGVIVVRSADLERELAQYDPIELVAAANLQMVQDNAGNVIGISSPRFGDLSLSNMVGLQNGDVVLQVNGMPVTSELAVFEIANALQGETNFAAQILRSGHPVTLRVRVQ